MATNYTSGTVGAMLGGAILGFAMTLLMAPQPGETLREKLKRKLSEHSVILSDIEVDELIARLEEDDEELA